VTDSPAAHEQRFVPALSYADAPAAIEFLCRAFGFDESFRLEMPDGSIGHAELTYRDATISLASAWTEGGLGSPRSLPASLGRTRSSAPANGAVILIRARHSSADVWSTDPGYRHPDIDRAS